MFLVSEESAKSCFTVGNLDNLTSPVGIIVGDLFNSVNHLVRSNLDRVIKLLSTFIIWLCFTRTGNYQIDKFDWQKTIFKEV